jgi:hypothetical protein
MNRIKCFIVECGCIISGCALYLIVVGILLLVGNSESSTDYKTGIIVVLMGSVCFLVNIILIVTTNRNDGEIPANLENVEFEMEYFESIEIEDEDCCSLNSETESIEFIKIDI